MKTLTIFDALRLNAFSTGCLFTIGKKSYTFVDYVKEYNERGVYDLHVVAREHGNYKLVVIECKGKTFLKTVNIF